MVIENKKEENLTLTLIHQLRYVGNLCIKDIDWLEGKKEKIFCAIVQIEKINLCQGQ